MMRANGSEFCTKVKRGYKTVGDLSGPAGIFQKILKTLAVQVVHYVGALLPIFFSAGCFRRWPTTDVRRACWMLWLCHGRGWFISLNSSCGGQVRRSAEVNSCISCMHVHLQPLKALRFWPGRKVSGLTPTEVFALATPKSPINRGGRWSLQLVAVVAVTYNCL
jgi:hypothetical protein